MFQRIWLIASKDFLTYVRRPMVWVWIVMITLVYWGVTSGSVMIGTGGDSMIGGTKQHLSSEFEVTRLMCALTMVLHGFFATVLFGMAVIRDHDSGMTPLLHSSRLTTREYLIGKYLGCLALVLLVLVANALIAMLFMYPMQPSTRGEYFGEFKLMNFIWPIIKFALPSLIFLGGAAFFLGTLTRKPILVFAFPLMFLLLFGLFLNNWSPAWLPVWSNDLLGLLDPYGTRWLRETWTNVDRGAEFYNTQSVGLGTAFLISRIAIAAIGLLSFAVTIPLFSRYLRGSKQGALSAVETVESSHAQRAKAASESAQVGLSSLAMQQTKGGLLSDTWNIMRYELKELRYSPSLYLFVPFIILEVVGIAFFVEGAFGTPQLHTSGSLAQGAMSVLALLGCLLMMFYTVESQLRERTKKLAPIYYSTRAKSFAMLLGKSLANTGVCVVIIAAALVGSLVYLLIQGIVQIELFPFAAYWLLLLMPTFIFWGSFITFLIVLTRSRYTTYGIAAGVLVGTLYLSMSGEMSWMTNWMLSDLSPWSDISVFEIDRTALVLNRLFAISLAILFTYLAARMYWRRGFDAVQMAGRFKPVAIGKFVLKAIPFLMLPTVIGTLLYSQVDRGHQGDVVKDLEQKYWQQNFSTWANTKPPAVSGVDLHLTLDPAQQALEVQGTFRLTNNQDEPMSRFALTGGAHWKDVKWKRGETFVADDSTPPIPDGSKLKDFEPRDRSMLYEFKFDPPIQPGESTTLGYSFHGRYPDGVSKNGGDHMQFILPSGVVLNTFGTAFFPMSGFEESMGLDENQPEAKVYEDDFFEDQLKPLFGGGDAFHVRTTITGPSSFTFNGVGTKKDEKDAGDGLRTVVWETDSPVSFFNIVGGQWKVHNGQTTTIYYNAKHDYNVDELSEALDAARAWYSKWFAPYPWKELRLNEFPNMSTYAQGFATNITFSEGIGFLTKDKPGADAPFMVAAHEAAHQWWGNILVPGQGPGGNILSEGMAHFSTGLLFDQVKGEGPRIAFFELIEDSYGNRRSVDSERPLVKIDGSKRGDTTVTYDKGGWVFWMLLNHMGRTENLQGIQSFIKKYSQGPDDYPVLQDFVNHMREFATDKEAYDEFTDQWFFKVVMPQYEFADVKISKEGEQWLVSGSVKNVGTGKMPLEICVAAKDRFIENELNEEYQEARTSVTPSTDEKVSFEVRCSFEPDRVLVDPDAKVLQLSRKRAVHTF